MVFNHRSPFPMQHLVWAIEYALGNTIEVAFKKSGTLEGKIENIHTNQCDNLQIGLQFVYKIQPKSKALALNSSQISRTHFQRTWS